jgi:hypothetical protein
MNEGYFVRKRFVNFGMSMLNLFPDSLLARNKKFKNIHAGERCFILGSGHSIMTQDLTKLKNEIVITQNHFHSHKDIDIIQPKYHVVIPKFHPSEYDKDWIDWICDMEKKLPADTTFFFGTNTKAIIDSKTGLSPRTNYINAGFHSIVMNHAKVDITKRIMNVPTVITQCITIALYMGFKKIYLAGFDLDQICLLAKSRDDVRFYGHSQITKNEAEKKIEDDSGSSGFDFFNYWLIWRQLNLLKKYAGKNNMEIVNVANGGMLNVFRRDNFDKVISEKL